ncbi:MAG TPA: tyrosine-type recombinase/integrase [Acidimicrobiales bacterium]|nr:tyrosine-type recombinase/integrase [Acidimicrobiales bacterium]
MSGAPLTVSEEDEDLIAVFAAELEAAGLRAWASTLGGARAFCARYGGPAGFAALAVDEQLQMAPHLRQFACWLMVTGRMRVSAEYLAQADQRLGTVARSHYSELHRHFSATAAMLGSNQAFVAHQWNLLAQLSALEGVTPDQLTAAQIEDGGAALVDAFSRPGRPKAGHRTRSSLVRLKATAFHAGLVDVPPRLHKPNTGAKRAAEWARVAPTLAATAQRYVEQISLSLRPSTVTDADRALRELGCYLAQEAPEVTAVADIDRHHIEAYKTWLAGRPRLGGGTLHRHTIRTKLLTLRSFFERITEWGYEDTPSRSLIFDGDLPIPDQPLPRFLDDATAAKLLRAARADDDPFVRLVIEVLARTGLRKGELMALTVDAVVHIGSAYWLRVPVGKLHNDRYIPLHPQLKELLDVWLADRPAGLRSELIFTDWGRPIPHARVDRALAKVAVAAGIQHVTAHQLRHTLATQAINRGMSLEAIAALLGHRTMAMTMVYARIADRTVADEYFSVSEKVEALYGQPRELPADAEGAEMVKLRRELHQRMLGNGYCARPVEMDCHFESICESCTFFVTTIEFRPTLERQRDDAMGKGQIGRQKIFDGLLSRLEEKAS